MDNNIEVKKQSVLTKKFSLWSPGYLIAGLVFYTGQRFNKTVSDEFIILTIAIVAGVLYSRLKKRVNFVKNDILKGIIVAIGLVIISIFLTGFLTELF